MSTKKNPIRTGVRAGVTIQRLSPACRLGPVDLGPEVGHVHPN
ncbi:MAG TPA: hypothetical protein PLA94_24945 [Myxococcota bacterium]|nr:hypothetical protein [Myxococcota bacterium]HND33279.1 hypothetical protein [Myxococcota bacterium]